MNYASLLHTVPEGLRKLFRTSENISKKLININWSVTFNNICLNEGILPNFTRIRHHDRAVSRTEPTMKYRRYLVEREIAKKKEQKKDL